MSILFRALYAKNIITHQQGGGGRAVSGSVPAPFLNIFGDNMRRGRMYLPNRPFRKLELAGYLGLYLLNSTSVYFMSSRKTSS